MSLPDRFVKKLERELVKGRARQRADKKAVARRMRRTLSSHLATTSPSDVMEGVKETPIINPVLEQPEEFGLPGVELAILNASRVKKHKGRKAKNSSVSRSPPLPASPTVSLPSPPPPPPPPSPPPPPQTPTPANVAHLERKIARLEAELLSKDRGRQKRTDAYNSMKNSEHQRMLDLMDARLHIKGLEAKLERLEEELEETKRETVSWVHRAEKFKAERYQAFSHTIDPTPPPPPPSAPRAIEWGALVRQPEFWAGAVGLVTLLAAVYVAGRYQGDGAPTVSFVPLFKLLKNPSYKQNVLTYTVFVSDVLVLPTTDSVPEATEG